MSNGEGGRIQGRGKEGTDDDNKDDDKDDDDDDDDDKNKNFAETLPSTSRRFGQFYVKSL